MISSVSTVSSSSSANPKSGNDRLGKDDFLLLLVTQLKNQDPLNPMDNTESIAQMAQFTTLEQMQNLNRVGELQQATSMIGKFIKAETYEITGIPETVYGKVNGIRTSNGQTYLVLDGGREVATGDLVSAMDESGLRNELANMVGKNVAVKVYDKDGNFVDARVVTVKAYTIQDGQPYIYTTENELISLDNVFQIQEDGEKV